MWLARQDHPVRRASRSRSSSWAWTRGEVVARFESERQALAIHGSSQHRQGLRRRRRPTIGRPYFVMEYVPGVPITAFCDRTRAAIAAAPELFVAGLRRRAARPSEGRSFTATSSRRTSWSPMHDGAPVVKVIDFGIAKALGARLPAETMVTPRSACSSARRMYMSPEQAGLTDGRTSTRAPTSTRSAWCSTSCWPARCRSMPASCAARRCSRCCRVIREDEPPPLASRLTRQSDAEIREVAKRRLTEPRALVSSCKAISNGSPTAPSRRSRPGATDRHPSSAPTSGVISRTNR